MGKRYFFSKRKENTSILRIVVVLALVLAGTALLVTGIQWIRGHVGQYTKTSALEQMQKANSLYMEGNWEGTKNALAPILKRGKDPELTLQALVLQASVARQLGQTEEMLSALKRALTEFPASPEYPAVATHYAVALENSGRMEEALALYASIRASAPPAYRAGATLGLGRKALRDKNLIEARKLFREAVNEADWDSPAWNDALDALGKVNVRLIFSPEATPESKVYLVEKGDNLTNIGIKLNTTQGLLTRANGITESTQLSIGQSVKYTPKDFRIVVERSACRLFLLDKDGLFKRYFVGLGMPGHETVIGKYTIGNKQKDPTWFKPGGGPVAAGDPMNELGTRWMPLVPSDAGLPTDLGIHGTIAPETIGHYKSHGCPRMLKEDVEELFDLVVRSTPVDIVEKMEPVKPAS